VFARLINSTAVALQTTGRILKRYQDVPVEATFSVDAKDRDIEIGEIVFLDHGLVQTASGAPKRKPWIITSAHEFLPGEASRFTAEDASLAGVISVIMATGSPDYQGDGSDQFDGAWICGPDGNYSNGDAGARIQ